MYVIRLSENTLRDIDPKDTVIFASDDKKFAQDVMNFLEEKSREPTYTNIMKSMSCDAINIETMESYEKVFEMVQSCENVHNEMKNVIYVEGIVNAHVNNEHHNEYFECALLEEIRVHFNNRFII
jgi:hypothetical protein